MKKGMRNSLRRYDEPNLRACAIVAATCATLTALSIASLSSSVTFGSEPAPSAHESDQAPPVAESAPTLPDQAQAQTGAVALKVFLIPSPVPSYIDRGVTMVPLRPIADFLNITINVHSGIITLLQHGKMSDQPTMATIRLNGRAAQIAGNGKLSALTLRLPVESRMGNTFVPLRFMADTFHAKASFRVPDNAIVLRTDEKIGVLTPHQPPEFSGHNAAILTIVNHIGKPMSLRLNGPQKIALELGRGQKITRRVAPGVYYYKAVCAGMRPRSGARRLGSGRRINWTWGRGG